MNPLLRVILGGMFSLAVLAPTAVAAERRPNFLVILCDNIGPDWFGSYGSDEKCTPNVDRLAAGGVRFEHFYMTPLCSTSRAEFYTGRYGFRTGWHTHHDAAIYGGGGFDWNREMTWARVLQSAGYATAIAGKWQINDLIEEKDALSRHGFDEHFVWTGNVIGEGNAEQRWLAYRKAGEKHKLESRYWDPVVFENGKRQTKTGQFGPDLCVDFLVDFMQRRREQPFVAFYSNHLVHVPTVPTPASEKKTESEREQFAGMVRYLDGQVGRLEKELERLGFRDDTIIVFTSDNGSPARLAGTMHGQRAPGGLGTLTEGGLDVPMIVNCPARIAQGRVSAALIDASDVFPTLAELAGAKMPTDRIFDGRSFAGQLLPGVEAPPARTWIFSQYGDTRVIRDRRFKLFSTGALYDLQADPREKNNLATNADSETAAARTRLQAVLDQLPPNENLPFPPRNSRVLAAP